MGIQRESILRGPGAAKLGTVQLFDKDGISADVETPTFDINVSAFGNLDTRMADALGRVTLTPCGNISAPLLAALYPYQTPNLGAEIFGSADVPCEVHSIAGTKVTFKAAAVTRMPSIRLSAKQTLFGGPVEITCVIANNADRDDEESLYVMATEAFSGSVDRTEIKCLPVAATWGITAPWDNIRTSDGWTIDFDLTLTPEVVDDIGTIGMKLDAVTARARCTPVGITEAQILAARRVQGTGRHIGATMRTGNDLNLVATGGVTVSLKDAALVSGPISWGAGTLRAGEIGFVAHREINAGVGGPVFTVGLTPPV